MDGLDFTDSPSSKEKTSDPQSAKLRQRFCIVDGIIDAHQAVPAPTRPALPARTPGYPKSSRPHGPWLSIETHGNLGIHHFRKAPYDGYQYMYIYIYIIIS